MIGQQVGEPVVAERPATTVGKDRRVRCAAPFFQPGSQRRRRVLAQRRAALFTSFAFAAHMGTRAELDVFATQVDQFRGP